MKTITIILLPFVAILSHLGWKGIPIGFIAFILQFIGVGAVVNGGGIGVIIAMFSWGVAILIAFAAVKFKSMASRTLTTMHEFNKKAKEDAAN